MADDREVLREVWEGKVPVCFVLAAEEVFTMEQPDPYYVLVPRQSYFPLVTDKVQRHFSKYVDPDSPSEMWLEDEGLPIKWHYPIGVLFDLLGSPGRLPWQLTVHFKNYPEGELLHCGSRDVVESHFISTIKEADSLKHRGQVIQGMQKKDHKQLWIGLQNDKFDQFWSVNRKLMDHTGDDLFKHIPFRIHQTDHPFIQKIVRPVTDNGTLMTLRELLMDAIPEHTQENGELKTPVLIQGVEVPLDTSVHWLSEHMSYPDNFLHICVPQR